MPSLLPLPPDCDPRVRALAADTLGVIGLDAKAAVPALTESLHDPSPLVRDAAALALQEMGPEAKYAIPAQAEMLCDPDGYLRRWGLSRLSRQRKWDCPLRRRRASEKRYWRLGLLTIESRLH